MTYALLTGASKGIGKEMAVALAKRKTNLLLVARSENELISLATLLNEKYSVSVFYKAMDLSLAGADEILYKWCVENNFKISILINNAGYGLWGSFEHLKLSEQQNMMRINTSLPVELTYRILPILKEHKPSYILNVASTASYQAVPTLSLYAATKSFLLSFSRGLRYEIKDSGVSVSCLCPGPVKTGFVDRAGMQSIKEKADKFGMEADEVAETAIRGMFNKKAEIIPGFLNKLGVFIVAITPKSLVEFFIASVYKK